RNRVPAWTFSPIPPFNRPISALPPLVPGPSRHSDERKTDPRHNLSGVHRRHAHLHVRLRHSDGARARPCLAPGASCAALRLAAILLAAPARAVIVIGVAGPMTGSNAAFGEQFRRGAERAVADLNAKGGVLGQKLRLVTGDDACDPKQAVSVANDLASKGAVFVAGHYCSSSSIPASDVYAESGIVQISPASTATELTDRKLTNV